MEIPAFQFEDTVCDKTLKEKTFASRLRKWLFMGNLVNLHC